MCLHGVIRVVLGFLLSGLLVWTLPAAPPKASAPASRPVLPFSNTGSGIDQLIGNDHAILLENEFLDTRLPRVSLWPAELQMPAEPGAYIVQSRGPITAAFRQAIAGHGGEIVCYVPNNSLLVRGANAFSNAISELPLIQAVVPLSPGHKLSRDLLEGCLSGELPGADTLLHVLEFPGQETSLPGQVEALGARVLGQGPGPFGPVLTIRLGRAGLTDLARMPAVQRVERKHQAVLASDLARARLGVAPEASLTNHLGLTGSDVFVGVLDTGVDAAHPALTNRVYGELASALTDTNGHGTLIAGVIAGDGTGSTNVTAAPGSLLPATEVQYRGMAPAAALVSVGLQTGLAAAATGEQLAALAKTNVLIVNQSWVYEAQNTYDLSSAIYDSAVRDALPGASGNSPLLIVVAAGNLGAGEDSGTGGLPGSIQSPATAKNVLTVGAIEQLRSITNQVWWCTTNDPPEFSTNAPWLTSTDSSNRVCSWSARGNVGIGLEGSTGRRKPDVVAPGSFLVSARSGETGLPLVLESDRFRTNIPGADAYSEVLGELNEGLAPEYRFESGTSIAAASVSGMLALMEQFFREQMGRTNSPALTKALLINGARTLAEPYGFAQAGATNFQGWGVPDLRSTVIPGTTNAGVGPMLALDQDAAGMLATGEASTRMVTLSEAASAQPLRVTLVWTDPAAHPMVATKLVNDLDLVVTNMDTGEVYFGNDFAEGDCFSHTWAGGASAADRVNNVENVFVSGTTGSNYSITVVGHRVNVNAVSSQSAQVGQDFALVISSGDGLVPDALTITNALADSAGPVVTALTNTFELLDGQYGQVLLGQRLGAHTPALATNLVTTTESATNIAIGDTNQWRFYVVTNEPAFPHAAFVCFEASELTPGWGTPDTNTSRMQADLDLYVSLDPGLLQLNPAAVANAQKALGRSGTEFILTTSGGAEVFYVGVKCESQQGADYGIAAAFSEKPFSETDPQGNLVVRGFPRRVVLPDQGGESAGRAVLIALTAESTIGRRIIVTNEISHERMGDLVMGLTHENRSAMLLNRSPGSATNELFIFDDTAEQSIPGARASEGPGSLRDFRAIPARGVWLLSLSDEGAGIQGTNVNFDLCIEPQKPLSNTVSFVLAPGACREEFLRVPAGSTNLSFQVNLVSTGEVQVAVYRLGDAADVWWTNALVGPGTFLFKTHDLYSHPPLQPGRYAVRLCGGGGDPAEVEVKAILLGTGEAGAPLGVAYGDAAPILDDAATVVSLVSTNQGTIRSLEVGLHIEHPRLSDLAITLISPAGTRARLIENRGGDSTNGLGRMVVITNQVPVSSEGGPEASTNILNTGQSEGVLALEYEFYGLPDMLRVYYETNLLMDTGMVSGNGATNVAYGPGDARQVTIVVNEGGNFDENTAWYYLVTWSHPARAFATFTENTALTQTPIKFAMPPFTNVTYTGPGLNATNGLVYLPEESLARFAGESAEGEWRLEIVDARAGGNVPSPLLVDWQLVFALEQTEPLPVPIAHGQLWTVAVPPGGTQTFAVAAPAWALFATNSLLNSPLPVDFWFSSAPGLAGTNAGDALLLSGQTNGIAVLDTTNTALRFTAGGTYYLSVVNTNAERVNVAVQVDFDLTPLVSGVPMATAISADRAVRYFSIEVSTNATAASFQVLEPGGDVSLAIGKGLPFPELGVALSSALPGTNAEVINLFTTSLPVPLSSGTWLIGVFHSETNDIPFTIVVNEYTNAVAEVVTLENGAMLTKSDSGQGAVDYYRFVVSTNALRVQFEIAHSSADMMLVASKGLPLPGPDVFQFRSNNPWTNTEVIVVHRDSSPVPLSPGEWFLGAVNLSGAAVSYGIKATEWARTGLDFAITRWEQTGSTLCLTWTSLPGAYYFVEGTAELNPAQWAAISQTLVAENDETTWCLDWPSTNRFFRIAEGITPGPCLAQGAAAAIEAVEDAVLLHWPGPICGKFQVQWTESLGAGEWVPFTNVVTSTNAMYHFRDGEVVAPGTARYYRLIQLP